MPSAPGSDTSKPTPNEPHEYIGLNPAGWLSVAIGQEESPDLYAMSWQVAHDSDAGIAPNEEMEYSLVTTDKGFLSSQKFEVHCDHFECNFEGWTRLEGKRRATIVPKLMR